MSQTKIYINIEAGSALELRHTLRELLADPQVVIADNVGPGPLRSVGCGDPQPETIQTSPTEDPTFALNPDRFATLIASFVGEDPRWTMRSRSAIVKNYVKQGVSEAAIADALDYGVENNVLVRRYNDEDVEFFEAA